MDLDDSKVLKDQKRRYPNEENRKRKRKRGSDKSKDHKTNGTKPLVNGVGKDNMTGEEKLKDTKADVPVLQNGTTTESFPSPTKRTNPFSMSTENTPTPKRSPPTPTKAGVLTPAPSISKSTLLSSKRVVQFHGSDDSDDSEYVPQSKRKESTLLSPHLGKSIKGNLLSPKKVDNREKLLNRKRELQEEREKLPIWTGM